MRVLGIDPGSNATGLALVELGPLGTFPQLVIARVVRPTGDWKDGARLQDLAAKLHVELQALWGDPATQPGIVAIEDPTGFRAPRAARRADAGVKLGAAYGICYAKARDWTAGLEPIITVPAQGWLPRLKGGPIHERHGTVRTLIRGWLRRIPEDLADDALFAAGIAVVAGQRAAVDRQRTLRQHATAP